MSGVTKLLWLPFAALALLLLGCGVPIPPEAITATAVAEEQAASKFSASGGGSNDTALQLRSASTGFDGASGQAAAPISTLAASTPTPEPEDTETAAEAEATAEKDTPEGDERADERALDEDDAEANEDGAEAADAATEVAPEATATAVPLVATANEAFATEFLSLLNAQRTGRGLGALTFNTTISNGASQYSAYMGTDNFFGHYGPDGSSPGSRVIAWGYRGAYAGEALSAGQGSPQAALNALLASPPHAAILLDPKAVEVGIGYAFVGGSRYRHYWTVVTAIP